MLEVGAAALFVDEDTSVTNFMIRDRRMQILVAKEKEPITPLIDKIRLLYSEKRLSRVLVVGDSGDYLDAADTVIAMEECIPKEVTAAAKRIVAQVRTERESEGGETFGSVRDRVVIAESVDASRGKRGVNIKVFDKREIGFGMYTIDLTALEQFVSTSQVRAVADALVYARDTYMNKKRCLREVVELIEQDFDEKGLDVLSKWRLGHYALPSKLEIAAALNRLRCLRIEFASQIQ
jgi:predicted ABC-class ATPase